MVRSHQEPQVIPVRLYQTSERLMIAAPMPGLEAEDIIVNINGNQVIIRSVEREPRQQQRDLLIEEWKMGPYFREVSLPQPVDGARTNATYGNGILVLVMPKRSSQECTAPEELRLQSITPTRGEYITHTGSEMYPTTMGAHRQKHDTQHHS